MCRGGSRQAGSKRGPAPRLVLVWLNQKHSEQLYGWQPQASTAGASHLWFEEGNKRS